MKKTKKGFTLIELLIVIAIIGILASIVLVSLNSARQKATYASFKASVCSIPAQIQVCQDSNIAINDVVTPGVDEICDQTAGSDALYPAFPSGCPDAAIANVTEDSATGAWSFDATCVTGGVCEATCNNTLSGCSYTGC